MELFLELIEESMSENKKALVFSQFTSMLDILSRELDKQSRSHLLLTGKTKDRKSVVRAFNEDDRKRIFLISTKAGGTGLNLTAAERRDLFKKLTWKDIRDLFS